MFACDEALTLVESYEPPDPPAETVIARAGFGAGATEAPRGLLFHTYDIDAAGTIRKDFAESIEANSVHGSDSAETAAQEIAFFFAGTEIVG